MAGASGGTPVLAVPRPTLLRDALAAHRAVLVRLDTSHRARRGAFQLDVLNPVALAPGHCLAWSRRSQGYRIIPLVRLRDVRPASLASGRLPTVPAGLAAAIAWSDTSLPRPDGTRPARPGPARSSAPAGRPRPRRPGPLAVIPVLLTVAVAVAVLSTPFFR